MITRSRSRLAKHIHNNTNSLNNKMNTETVTTVNSNSEVEFDINNQLGDINTLNQITMENQETGMRGQDDEETETQQITAETQKEIRARPTQQTLPEAPKEIDIQRCV